mgnify:CR=1 FL=1
MPSRLCKTCGQQFFAKPFSIRQGWGKYCSAKCQYLGFRKGRWILCEICKKRVYKSRLALAHSKSGKSFCSKSCQTKWRNTQYVGEKHLLWKGGKAIYRELLLKSAHKQVCKLCGEKDIRVLAAHHIDEDRRNNKINNLVWLCQNCHQLVHHDNVEKLRLAKLLKM